MTQNEYRIAIVGTSGSGKSTLARKICDILECDHIEMDAYFWQPNWVEIDEKVFVESIDEACSRKTWVACGNYSNTRDLVWEKATHLIWIKLPFIVVMWQLFKRTMKNIIKKQPIAGGNIETFKQQFFSKKSIFLWAINTHNRRARVYKTLLEEGPYGHLKISILRSNRQVRKWLKELEKKRV